MEYFCFNKQNVLLKKIHALKNCTLPLIQHLINLWLDNLPSYVSNHANEIKINDRSHSDREASNLEISSSFSRDHTAEWQTTLISKRKHKIRLAVYCFSRYLRNHPCTTHAQRAAGPSVLCSMHFSIEF